MTTGDTPFDLLTRLRSWVFFKDRDITLQAGRNIDTSGGTVDGVDLPAHVADADAHHNQSHVLATTGGLGADHTTSGLTAGEVLRASGATTAAFQDLDHGDLVGVGVDDHHNQSHVLATTAGLGADHTTSGLTAGEYLRATAATTAAFQVIPDGDLPSTIVRTSRTLTAGSGLTGGGDLSADRTFNVGAGNGLTINTDDVALTTPGTLSVSSTNSATGSHTHAVTASSDPGGAAALLKSTSAGKLTLADLEVDGDIGVGTSSPATGARVHTVTEGNGGIIIDVYANTGGGAPLINTRRAAGTIASPSAVSSGFTMGFNSGYGYGSSQFNLAAQMAIEVDGSVSGNDVPGKFTFYTHDAGDTVGTVTARAVLFADGRLGIRGTGGSVPSAHTLQLNDDDAAKTTTTTWTTTSDKRTKRNVKPWTEGTGFIVSLPQVVEFEYNGAHGTPRGEKSVGFLAQDLIGVAPGLLRRAGKIYSTNPHNLIFALVNAVKEIDDRLIAGGL